jgi:hypothetical protein
MGEVKQPPVSPFINGDNGGCEDEMIGNCFFPIKQSKENCKIFLKKKYL